MSKSRESEHDQIGQRYDEFGIKVLVENGTKIFVHFQILCHSDHIRPMGAGEESEILTESFDPHLYRRRESIPWCRENTALGSEIRE